MHVTRLLGSGLTGEARGGTAPNCLYDLARNDPAGVSQTTDVCVAGTLVLGGPLTFDGHSLSIAHAIAGTPNNLVGDATSTLIINGAGSGIVVPSSLAALLNLTISNANGAALTGPPGLAGPLTLRRGHRTPTGHPPAAGPPRTVARPPGPAPGRPAGRPGARGRASRVGRCRCGMTIRT